MKIRLDGTKEEATKFAEDLEMYYDVIRVSRFCPNTIDRKSKEGRIYIEAKLSYIDKSGNLVRI